MNGPLGTITKWHFHSTSNEVIWPKKNLKFHRRVKKVPFCNFSKWAGMAVPCQVGPQNPSQELKNYFCFGRRCIERLEGKIRECLLFYG